MVLRAGRAWVIMSLLASAACDDFALPRAARAPADSSAGAETSVMPAKPPGSKRQTTVANEEARFAEIRRTLRRLVAAEETFFAENGTYSDDLALIGFRPEDNTTIRFFWLSREGWAASGMHTEMDGKDCVVFVGQASAAPTTLKYVRSGPEGALVCDDPRRPAKPVADAPPSEAPRAPETPNPLDALDPRVVMKVDLRNLAHSQQTYLAMQGVYASRPESMALQYLWHHGVRVEILGADAESWAAKATHDRFPGKSCVIWFGRISQRPRTEALKRQEGRPGEPVCDD